MSQIYRKTQMIIYDIGLRQYKKIMTLINFMQNWSFVLHLQRFFIDSGLVILVIRLDLFCICFIYELLRQKTVKHINSSFCAF